MKYQERHYTTPGFTAGALFSMQSGHNYRASRYSIGQMKSLSNIIYPAGDCWEMSHGGCTLECCPDETSKWGFSCEPIFCKA
jgi:hypothetical protein